MLVAAAIVGAVAADNCLAQSSSPADADQAMKSLAATLSRVIAQAIPPTYEKKEDWGATTEIPVGVRVHGKPFHYHYERRTKAVDHGLWKHYALRLADPNRDLRVQVTELTPLDGGRTRFTIVVDARLDCWARAKAYQLGVHLGAYELEANCEVRISVQGDVGLVVGADQKGPTFTLDPRVSAASLRIDELRIRRVSSADGPLVKSLSDGVRRLIEEQLDGERLAAKLNKAIDKKRDRLTYRLDASDLFVTPR